MPPPTTSLNRRLGLGHGAPQPRRSQSTAQFTVLRKRCNSGTANRSGERDVVQENEICLGVANPYVSRHDGLAVYEETELRTDDVDAWRSVALAAGRVIDAVAACGGRVSGWPGVAIEGQCDKRARRREGATDGEVPENGIRRRWRSKVGRATVARARRRRDASRRRGVDIM